MATKMLRLFVGAVAALTLFGVMGCEQAPVPPLVSPSYVAVPTIGTLTATPGSVSLGSPVTVSWTAGSSVRVDACQSARCTTLATGPSSGEIVHKPDVSGEWRYQLFGSAAGPDVNVRLAEARVTVQ